MMMERPHSRRSVIVCHRCQQCGHSKDYYHLLAASNMLNTWLAVGGLQLAGKADEADRKALRVGASLLPLFAVSWFFGVLALENSASLAFSLLFLASHSFLSWFMYICWLPGERGPWRDTEEDDEDEEEDLIFEEVKSGTDDQPLLLPRDELQMDPICTISS